MNCSSSKHLKFENLGFFLLLLVATSGPVLIDMKSIEPFGPIKFLALGGGGLIILCWLCLQTNPFSILKTHLGLATSMCLAVAFLTSAQAATWPFASEELFRLSLLFVICAAANQITWTEKRLIILTHLLLVGSTINGMFVLAEHLNWDWRLYQQKGRLIGLFGYQNLIAQFMIIPACLGIYFFAKKNQRGSFLISLQLFFLLSILTLLLCRGAWLGLAGALLYMIIRTHKVLSIKKVIALIMTASVIGLMLLNIPIAHSQENSPLASKKDIQLLTKDSGRRVIYKQCLEAIKQNPILGSGSGNFPVIYQKVDRDRGDFRRYAHNDLLQWTTETGLIGLIALTFLIVLVIQKLSKLEGYEIAVGACLVATFIHSLVSYNFYVLIPATLCAVFLGILSGQPTKIELLQSQVQWSLRGLALLSLIVFAPRVINPILSSRLQKESSSFFNTQSISPEEHRQRHQQALIHLQKAAAFTPHDPTLLWQKSHSELTLGEIHEGQKTLLKLQSLTPYNDRVHLMLAHIYAHQGNSIAQIECLEKAFDVVPHSRSLMDELWILYSRSGDKRYEKKRTLIEKLYQKNKWWDDEKPILISRLHQGATREELINANLLLTDQLLVTPNDIEIMMQIGSIRYQLRLFESALEIYQNTLKLMTNQANLEPASHTKALMATGNILNHLGRWQEGAEIFHRGMELYPEEIIFFEQVFRYQLNSTNLETALETIKKSSDLGSPERETKQAAAQILSQWNPGSKIAVLEGLDLLNELVRKYGEDKDHLARGEYLERVMKRLSIIKRGKVSEVKS